MGYAMTMKSLSTQAEIALDQNILHRTVLEAYRDQREHTLVHLPKEVTLRSPKRPVEGSQDPKRRCVLRLHHLRMIFLLYDQILLGSPEKIGRLIEKFSQGMDAGSFNFAPMSTSNRSHNGPGHSNNSSLSTNDWTIEEIDNMLTSINRP